MASVDYVRVEKAIRFIDENFRRQPALGEIARSVGLSEYHFQRLFRRWAGVSPKRFLQFVTAEHARSLLRDSHSVLGAAYETGLSGPGRLHDLMVSIEAMTPGEVRRQGAGIVVSYGYHPSPFGDCLVAMTERGLCGLAFVGDSGRTGVLEELRERWPAATLREDSTGTAAVVKRIFSTTTTGPEPLPLFLQGTNYQVKVWEALLRIPPGAVATYESIAEAVDSKKAARAVGAAIGRNPVGYVIPCHRAIHKTGGFGAYHWGAARKRAILGWEAARLG